MMKRERAKRRLSLLLAAVLVLALAFEGMALANEYQLEDGDVEISAKDDGSGGKKQTVRQNSTEQEDDDPVVTQKDPSKATSNTVKVTSDGSTTANVTVKDVNIAAGSGEAGIKVDGSAEITVEGKNTVSGGKNAAGIEAGAGDSLTLTGDGEITANAGDPTKSQGTGAGIGGASDENGGDVTVTANGAANLMPSANGNATKDGSAGIGGGSGADGGAVEIGGNASVTANGGGIGLMPQDENKPDMVYSYTNGGAGIGGVNGGTVTIGDNASVTANGGYNAAGVGSSNDKKNGVANQAGSVTVSDQASLTASGGYGGAGIGGGARQDGGTLTVEDNASVTAVGGVGAAGIGGGSGGFFGGATDPKNNTRDVRGGNGGTVKMTGGTVTAVGGKGAAGIGGGAGAEKGLYGSAPMVGEGGNGGSLTVVDGTLSVVGGVGGVGVGSGSTTSWTGKYTNNKLTVTGGTTYSQTNAADHGTITITSGNGSAVGGSAGFAGALSNVLFNGNPAYTSVIETAATALLAGRLDFQTVIPGPNPAPNPNPGAPTAAPVNTPVPGNPVVPENETPLSGPTEVKSVSVPDMRTPLAAPENEGWALMNLILMILTVLDAGLLIARYFVSRREGVARYGFWRLSSLVPAAGAVIAFFLTENMQLSMELTDQWTLLMAALLLVNLGFTIITKAVRDEAKN